MKVAFYKAYQPKATLMDNVVACCSNGKYSHVELVFDDVFFSISSRDKEVRFKKIKQTNTWDFINIEISKEIEKQMIQKAKTYTGAKYDYIGAIFSISPICIQKKDRYFCSEICTELLKEFIFSDLTRSCQTSPNMLYNELIIKTTKTKTKEGNK